MLCWFICVIVFDKNKWLRLFVVWLCVYTNWNCDNWNLELCAWSQIMCERPNWLIQNVHVSPDLWFCYRNLISHKAEIEWVIVCPRIFRLCYWVWNWIYEHRIILLDYLLWNKLIKLSFLLQWAKTFKNCFYFAYLIVGSCGRLPVVKECEEEISKTLIT